MALLVGLVIAAPVPTLAQIATGTIAGRVADDQGGGVPGATVTLVSATRGTTIDGVTNESGDFVIPNIPRDTYLVRVTMDGFKTVERPNVEVSPGQRVVVPTLTITVGALNETVTVTGEAPMIQSQTGERSFTVSAEAIQELPMNSRNWSAFTALTPGVVGRRGSATSGSRTTTSCSTASPSWIPATTAPCCRPTSMPSAKSAS